MAFQARWLEGLGFNCIAVGEHFMRGNPPAPSHTALPLLGVAAGSTDKIGLLSSILLTPFYHPTILAKMTTTLDIASSGRLMLGVGVGGEFPMEFGAAEIPITKRGDLTNECLYLLQRLWTEEHITYHGKHFTLDDVSLSPSPFQKPHPPIWVAGRKEAAMKRAALFGNGWLPYFFDPDQYRTSVKKILAYSRKSGRPLGQNFQWGLFPYISIYPTVEEASRIAAETLSKGYLYRGNFMDVVRRYCIVGPTEYCVKRLKEYVKAGARYIVFSIACPSDDIARHIETIATEIIPGLREINY